MNSAFSVEISNVIPDGVDWDTVRPFQFLCGSIVTPEGQETYWDAADLYTHLHGAFKLGDLYSWNGIGFDFLTLYDSGIALRYSFILEHYDMLFDFFCHHGYLIKLVNLLRGFGRETEADWLEKSKEELPRYIIEDDRDKIAHHSRMKTQFIFDIAKESIDSGGIMWVTNSGRKRMETMDRFLTVNECRKLPEPDTGWMKEGGLTRDRFLGWLGL